MRVVVQRVCEGEVRVAGASVGRIGRGLVVLAGLEVHDGAQQVAWMAAKVSGLCVFDDAGGTPSRLSVVEAGAEVLAVSQFTLVASCRKGRRPSFDRAMAAGAAAALFERFVSELRTAIPNVATGCFGADMRVHLVNDGPFTLMIDSERDR